jgi:hypothetical protein
MPGFRDTPKHLVDADDQITAFAQMQPIGLADVDMAPVVVILVKPQEGFEGDPVVAVIPLIDDLRFDEK